MVEIYESSVKVKIIVVENSSFESFTLELIKSEIQSVVNQGNYEDLINTLKFENEEMVLIDPRNN